MEWVEWLIHGARPFSLFSISFKQFKNWLMKLREKKRRLNVFDGLLSFAWFFGGLWPLPAAGAPPKEANAKRESRQEEQVAQLFCWMKRVVKWIQLIEWMKQTRQWKQINKRWTKPSHGAASPSTHSSFVGPLKRHQKDELSWMECFLLQLKRKRQLAASGVGAAPQAKKKTSPRCAFNEFMNSLIGRAKKIK